MRHVAGPSGQAEPRDPGMKNIGRRAFNSLCAASALGFGLRQAAAHAAEFAHAHRGSGPDDAQQQSVALRWNARARQVIAKLGMDPPRASRLLMLLSVAQHDAAHYVLKANNVKASDETSIGTYRSEIIIALSEVYEVILHHVAPEEEQSSDILPEASEINYLVDVQRSRYIGRKVAQEVLKKRRDDDAALQKPVTPPVGPAFWRSFQNQPPVRPWWGWARPVVLPSIEEFISPAPPAVGTAAFKSALNEVRELAGSIDDAGLKAVHFWADGKGTATPPGHWNEILQDILGKRAISDTRILKILSLLNVAMMDAGIACWRTKYTYWMPRPRQIDYRIRTHLTEPNFPAYTSGHSAFSNAAAQVIGAFLPGYADEVRALADEASLSRLYAGIHYRFDIEEGARQGRSIGRLVARMRELDGPLLSHLAS